MPGPAPTPTPLLKLSGSWRGKARKDEWQPGKGAKCPVWLDEEAKLVWKSLAPAMEKIGILAGVDVHSFACYCQAVADFRSAVEDVREHGATTVTDKGYVMANPSVARKNQAMMQIKEFADRFGLNPAARVRVKPVEKQKPLENEKTRFFSQSKAG